MYANTGTPTQSTLDGGSSSTLLIGQQEEEEAPDTATTFTTVGPIGGVDDAGGAFLRRGEGLSLRDVALVGEWTPHSEAVVSLEVGRIR